MSNTSPTKAIRLKCLDCCCGQANEVKLCPVTTCPLHSFRFGTNPHRTKKEYTPEERAILAERLRANLNKTKNP